mmetsp:Transcript_23399/g.37505  ORF Transcript_23399/g.37505 Transcript_23399/m.37505 type:complete len:110 (-) Transcript_23399:393-722(-)
MARRGAAAPVEAGKEDVHGGCSLDGGRQLSAAQPIRSGGCSGEAEEDVNGGFSLDSERQLGTAQPISSGGCGGEGEGEGEGVLQITEGAAGMSLMAVCKGGAVAEVEEL